MIFGLTILSILIQIKSQTSPSFDLGDANRAPAAEPSEAGVGEVSSITCVVVRELDGLTDHDVPAARRQSAEERSSPLDSDLDRHAS
jgi:hypothetical protein